MEINLFYRWNDEDYLWELYEETKNTYEKRFVGYFDDREDILLYIEANYEKANLIVRNNTIQKL